MHGLRNAVREEWGKISSINGSERCVHNNSARDAVMILTIPSQQLYLDHTCVSVSGFREREGLQATRGKWQIIHDAR